MGASGGVPPPALLREFFAAHSTLALAALGPGGAPLAAPLFFAADDELNLYVVSAADSRHSLAIARDGRVAASVYAETWDWQSIHGVQLEGVARALSGPERDAALAVYAAKFPFVQGMAALLDASTFYRITPHWIRWIDNRQGFGHKEEWRAEEDHR